MTRREEIARIICERSPIFNNNWDDMKEDAIPMAILLRTADAILALPPVETGEPVAWAKDPLSVAQLLSSAVENLRGGSQNEERRVEAAWRVASQLEALANALYAAPSAVEDAVKAEPDAFARVLNVIDALPERYLPSDDTPLRDALPEVWPTIGDLRALIRARKP